LNKEQSGSENLLRLNQDLLLKLNVRQLACGRDHILMLTGEGTVYALGGNEAGKLGVGRGHDELQVANTPIKVDSLYNIA
jgi:alpha-tubulin suppressor-like RCC1 family protein